MPQALANQPTQEIIMAVKDRINNGDLDSIQRFYLEILNTIYPTGQEPDIGYLFHKLYLHACLKGEATIADWLTRALYQNMDPIQQIALRQIFPYGRLLLSRASKKQSA
jgi:hypothetical protein